MSLAVPPTLRRRRFTLAEWHRAGEAGLFRPDERLELRHGEVIEMSPMGPRHHARVMALSQLFFDLISTERGLKAIQLPIVLLDETELLPDFAILRPRQEGYENSLPHAADALLVIEIADSSLWYDLGDKATDYAASGIPEYWVVDLAAREVVVHTDPRPSGAWGSVRRVGIGAALTPSNFPDLSISTEAIVGKG